jgi:hypothetical protein
MLPNFVIKKRVNKVFGYPVMPDVGDTGDSFSCVMSAETVDRDGEVLVPDGCDLTHYQNPVFFDHDTTKLIGVCQGVARTKSTPKSLQATVKLLPEPAYSDEVNTARNILRYAVPLGLKPGISVGFIRHETRKANQHDREKYGIECKQVTSKWELLEISLALVQCNREAFVTGVSKGYFSAMGLKSLGIDVPRRKVVVQAWSPPRRPAVKRLDVAAVIERELQKLTCRFR